MRIQILQLSFLLCQRWLGQGGWLVTEAAAAAFWAG